VAHSISAKKRVRQNISRKLVNRARKSKIKTQVKRLEQLLAGGSAEAAKEQYQLVAKKLDKIASTGTMRKRTAARKKSRLAKRLNKLAKAKPA
jgi:small subunit ribosomal protein S20